MKVVRGNTLTLGQTAEGKPFTLDPSARSRHLYVVGATRAGKSKFIENCIRQDIKQWHRYRCPVIFLDPHGQSYDDLVAWLAWHADDLPKDLPVLLLDPRQDYVVGYNVLRKRKAEPDVIVSSFIQAIAHAFGEDDVTRTPQFAEIGSNVLWVLYTLGVTLAESVYLTDFEQRALRQAVVEHIDNLEVRRDLRRYNAYNVAVFDDRFASTIRRFRPYVGHERLKWMFGQDRSLDWEELLDRGAIVLCNLSREEGRLGEENQRILGATLLHDLWLTVSERGKKKNMRPAYLYADEFPKFVSPTLAQNLAEAAGFGLHLTLSHQFPSQLLNQGAHGKSVYDEVIGNAQNKVAFHTEHPDDLRMLAELLCLSSFDPDKVHYVIESTKVMGYREVARETYTTGSSELTAESEAWSESAGNNSSRSEEDTDDGSRVTKSSGWNDASTRGGGTTRSRGTNESVSRSVGSEPVLGREISSIKLEGLDLQLHRAMVALKDQAQRQFVIKRYDLPLPATLTTPNVDDSPARPERIKRYIAKVSKKWNFIVSKDDAKKRIAERANTFIQRCLQMSDSESLSAKRIISRKQREP